MSNNFVLVTDDSCDLPKGYLEEQGIATIELSFIIDGKSYSAYEMPPQEFYALLKEGKTSKTAQVNVDAMTECFEKQLREDKDVLYLAFSSGLSGTANSGMVAAQELAPKYPHRKIIVVDTLAASMGMGLIVYKAAQMKNAGASVEEVAEWATENRLKMCHYFTVDDLMHLHRGGRVSKASAIAGSMLGIKPILHVDDAGKLIPVSKIRGRKAALDATVDRLVECMGDYKPDMFAVSHSDCEEDARYTAERIIKKTGVKKHIVNFIGPVIGSHTGRGTIAVFLFGERR